MQLLKKMLFAVLLCSLATVSNPVYGQAVSATLLGTVTDASGAAVPNATVVITATDTGVTHEVKTNDSGNYTFPDLTPGRYAVSATASSFKKAIRENIDVVVNTTSRVDVTLQTGDVNETVTVTDAPPMLQTDRADISVNFDTRQIEDMPLAVNRNFQGLLNLVPGTAPATFQHSQFFNAQSSLQTEVNGLPRQGNSYQIEGIDDNERTGLLQILIPPAEAIQTVDISTNNFEAELGRASGAVTNVILKSGTNQFHGFAEEFLQNQFFNAKNYFSTTLPHVAYNYFGGGIGGPIVKNKLFFYFDYLRTSDHEANNNSLTIPLKQFSTPVPCAVGGGQCLDLSAAIAPTKTANVFAGIIYDPNTGDPTTGAGRTPFPGNQIPMSRVNPVTLSILNGLPAENRPVPNAYTLANDYNTNLAFTKGSNTYDGKVDWVISSKDTLSGRYSYQSVDTFQAPVFGSFFGGPAQGGFEATGTQSAYSTGVNYARVFSPTLLTEARFGVAHLANNAKPSDYGSNDADKLGIPGVNIEGQPFTSGQVGISLGNFSSPIIGYSPSVPWVRSEYNIVFTNQWTKIIRNHTLKFGGDVHNIQDNLLQDQTFSPRGLYTFAENQTSTPGAATNIANDMASFLLDLPSQAGRDLNTFTPAYRQWWIFSFVNDKWQASPKLTLDLGLRWELYPPATPAVKGGFSNYDSTNNQLILAGVGGNPSNLGMKMRWGYLAPRTGFAYRATDQTVIRGGFGFSYTPYPDNSYAYNYPVRSNNAYNFLNSYQPAVLADNVTVPTFQAGFPAPVPVVIPSSGIIETNTPLLVAQNYNLIPTNWKNPYAMSWNVALQQALPGQFSFQLAYVANHGVDIATNQNINLPSVYGGGSASEPEYNLPNPLPGATLHRTASTSAIFLGYSSNYQSLQTQLIRHFVNGLATTTAFTWAKGMNYQTGDDGGLTFFIDQQRNYAPADYDRKLNFEESFTYELPIGKGKRWVNTSGVASSIIGGWKIAGIVSIVSGIPFTVTANGGTLNTPGTAQTANLVKPFHKLGKIGAGKPWFDTTSFAQPLGYVGTYPNGKVYLGNTGRNQFYGPGYMQNNLSMFKDFGIREWMTLNVRCDAFQLSNTPQFANPNSSLTSGTFGQVTGTLGSGSGVNGVGGGRALQLSAKLSF